MDVLLSKAVDVLNQTLSPAFLVRVCSYLGTARKERVAIEKHAWVTLAVSALCISPLKDESQMDCGVCRNTFPVLNLSCASKIFCSLSVYLLQEF